MFVLGVSYFQASNVLDILSIVLNYLTLILQKTVPFDYEFFTIKSWTLEVNLSMASVRIIGAFAALFMWIQLCFWLRLYDGYAKYIKLIISTLKDAFDFLVIIVFLMVGFGTAFYLLQIERIYRGAIDEEELLYPYDPSNFAFTQSIMNQYFILLGDFGAL